MNTCKYLIIGGGLAADAAARGIRELDTVGCIRIASDESDPPYDRPALSKALWKGSTIEKIWRHTDLAGVELRLKTRIVALDPTQKIATDANGNEIGYEQLLLATGASPRLLEESDPAVIYFRQLADFKRAWQYANDGAEFAVIGGGFIGSEMAAALAMNGRKVSMIFPGLSIGDRVYPRPLANFLNMYFRKHGVDVRFNERVVRVERSGDKLLVHTDGSTNIVAVDVAIAGIGTEPNVGLAAAAGLNVGSRGIIVDETLRTSHRNIFAAGDVTDFRCAALDQRVRFDHEDNACAMGRIAGRNMAGSHEPYRHLPYFYSDFFDLGYEAVGEIDSSMEIIEDWDRKFRKGALYYLRDSRVRGVLLWNTWGLVEAARQVIFSKRSQSEATLVGLLRESA
jgi:3-phenylpropionate/trans-cinnamate dioxygenase ferredoxin reductase component